MQPIVNYQLKTNKISITNNYIEGVNFTVNPQIQRTISVIDDTHSSVTYDLTIKNTDDNPFPVDIEVSITGIFDISKLNKNSVDDFLKIQTCQILFPQIRTIIASLTAAAIMPPLLLPIIDARALFSEDKNES